MASFIYNELKKLVLNGGIDFDGHDIRVALLMTNTTADTQNDGIDTINDFTTLDEFNGSGYVRKALTNETVTKDDTNDRAAFSADNVTWTTLGAGTRSVAGALIHRHVTNDTDSIPLAWIEFSATPDGNDFVIKWNSGSASGDIIRAT
jgi:hypothetical protein